jgi:hypothetical protein
MHRALICLLFCASAGSLAAAEVTVILDFEGPRSERSVDEMKRETQAIVKDSGLQLDWQTRTEAEHNSFPDLVVVRFKGRCIFRPAPYLYDELGPLAFTYATHGQLQPFSEISCDKVAASMRPAMHGGEFANADILMGRALGRVVAHELMHMVTRSGSHGRGGVGKAALSGKQLISGKLTLSRSDSERLAHPSEKY